MKYDLNNFREILSTYFNCTTYSSQLKNNQARKCTFLKRKKKTWTVNISPVINIIYYLVNI